MARDDEDELSPQQLRVSLERLAGFTDALEIVNRAQADAEDEDYREKCQDAAKALTAAISSGIDELYGDVSDVIEANSQSGRKRR